MKVKCFIENVFIFFYHIIVHEVPIHQMYLYDEVLQNKLNDELFKQELKQKKVDNINNNSSIYTDHRDSPFINPIPNTKYNDSSNITNLVKENMDLTKQTNTLAQAILLNLPTTSINVPKETTTEASTKIIDKKLEFEALKQFDTEFQKNIKTIEVNISEVNSTSKSHIQNTVKFGKDKTENNFDDRSLGQSLYSQPSSYDIRSNQTDLQNGNLERRSSVYSMYSNNSNLDSHSVSQTHNVQNINSYRNYIDNEVDFIDGSPFFEIKINSNLPKTNCINIKYPAHFAAKHCNQSEVQNHIQVNDAENCNGALQHSEKDEEYNIKKSVSPTRKNSKSLFSTNTIPSTSSILTVITLSQKCEKKLIHLLHLYEGGWVCVSEFVDAFTNLKDQRVMFKLLQFLKYEVDFRLLTRESDPQLFSLLDKSDLKVPRDEYKKIIPNFVLNVMPIKATLKVLDKLDFLNTQMLKDALHLMKKCTGNLENVIYEQFNNKILYDVLNLVMQYKHFKKLHSQSK